MNKTKSGIIALVIGVALIIVSEKIKEGIYNQSGPEDWTMRDLTLYGGIGLMVIGGIFLAMGMTKKVKS